MGPYTAGAVAGPAALMGGMVEYKQKAGDPPAFCLYQMMRTYNGRAGLIMVRHINDDGLLS